MVSFGWPVQGVMYDNSSTLWDYLECNPVTSVKLKKINVQFVGIDIGVMVNQMIGIRLTGRGMVQYAILVYPRCHHKCYIGRNPLHAPSYRVPLHLKRNLCLCVKKEKPNLLPPP